MVDVTTDYMGMELDNPLVPSASPLAQQLDSALELEDAGAAALVMHSLFEEQITREDEHLMRFFHQQSLGHAEADSFHPVPREYQSYQDQYLEHLRRLKSRLGIPVIASLNGASPGGWEECGRLLQEAGADALELNIYFLAVNPHETASQVEGRYLDTLTALRERVQIPIAVKLSHQFSALIPFTRHLQQCGAAGIVLFNRFYQPDIDLQTLRVEPKLELSTPREALLRIRWTAILADHLQCSIAVTGGVHSHEEVIKAILAGASVTQMCSALLQRGTSYIGAVLNDLKDWLEEHEYESIRQMRGSISQQRAINPAAYERANYLSVLDSYTPGKGVLR